MILGGWAVSYARGTPVEGGPQLGRAVRIEHAAAPKGGPNPETLYPNPDVPETSETPENPEAQKVPRDSGVRS